MHMDSLTLRYAEDPATGVPHLEDPGGCLDAADLDALGREIDRHFERLARGEDGRLFTPDLPAGPGLPRHFRVTVADRHRRCPTLVLEAVAPPGPAEAEPVAAPSRPEPVAAAAGRWQGQFLAELAELLAEASGAGGGRSPLAFVLGDLRALWRKHPRKFTLLLFAGYLHVGDVLSLRHGEGGDNKYARAAEDLAQLVGDTLPEGVLDPLLAPPAVGERGA
jgi:hypothetical protein